MIRAATFDLDGTLVDSLPGIAEGLNRALGSMHLPPHPVERVRSFIGNGSWMLARRALGGDAPDTQIDDLYAAFLREYAETWRHGTTVYPGVQDVLANLHADGLPLAVLSNKPHPFTVEMIDVLFGPDLFAPVLGQSEDTPRKPDPAGALRIASELGLPPGEIALVGDSTIDFETARAAGMKPVLVTWGFHPLERLRETAAPLVASAEDLRKSLQGRRPAS